MSDVAIRVEHLSKRYNIGRAQLRHDTLRDSVMHSLRTPFQSFKKNGNGPNEQADDTFWSLKDVSFEIKRGEVVGIIGRNGAGKSTLLKILSRITEPTEGIVEIHGRVGSLLEVGTGFHPELTGRENIYLNGAILGMKRLEIDRRFDEIVAFSEIEKFLDTPVKYYSSGMYVRLAFAVAAHLESEILLVDEVLAVGDVNFQKKCLGKIGDVAREGRTVLLVSHQMTSVTRLCEHALLLNSGQILERGLSHAVVGAYLKTGIGLSAVKEWEDMACAPGDTIARLRAVRVKTEDGQVSGCLDIREPVGVEMEFEVMNHGYILTPNLHFFNEEGICAFVVIDNDTTWRYAPRPIGRFACTAWIPANYLSEGTMVVGAALTTFDPMAIHFYERDAVAFQVVDSHEGDSARGGFIGSMPGVVRPLVRWTNECLP